MDRRRGGHPVVMLVADSWMMARGVKGGGALTDLAPPSLARAD